ncbi:50S ribosome-binding GTPase [Nostocaceae cyanobacterium CENA369]|uniref:50S ribosome-binding GTPase n=1 Tax=Dendronalium phyllosphericum CENA369 TaxID=1725256 RepID=A0A8J7IGN3_9NOST|nr:GTPase [Dendronalium phyllosphericum]MBH8577341.1 50S ribosome-binding GTPase [Dendronalium phyllosphericum CENA369]
MEELSVTEAVANVIKKIKAPNILVIGATGTGKSSLINAVFGEDLAQVGTGLPVTQGFHFYSNGLVNIYDSAGYELGEGSAFVNTIFEFLYSKQKVEPEKQIHIVWYVISAPSARIEQFDIDIISLLHKYGIPLLIVLSQVDRASEQEVDSLKTVLSHFDITQSDDVIEIAASPLIIRGKPICEPFGLEEVVARTLEHLPEIYADAVRIAQVVDLKSKRELAWKLIAAAAVTTFGSAFIPIPGVSTGTNLAIQASLPVSIASVYGFRDARKFLQLTYEGVPTKTLVGFAGATLGLDVFRSVIPILGNAIAGGTAATGIAIVGLAYASTFEAMAKAHIDPKNSEETDKFLIDNFQKELKKYSDIVIRTTKDLTKVKDRFLDQ